MAGRLQALMLQFPRYSVAMALSLVAISQSRSFAARREADPFGIASPSARAATMTFEFSQTGFRFGGEVTGYFSGEDRDLDGFLATATGEISDYALNFRNSSQVSEFSHDLSALQGLVYDLSSGAIALLSQSTNPQQTTGYTGVWDGSRTFGLAQSVDFVNNRESGDFTSSPLNLALLPNPSVEVTTTPEPQTLLSFLALLGLGVTAKRGSKQE